MKFLYRFGEPAYALVRVMSGLMFLAHGVQKYFNFPTDYPYPPLNPLLYSAGAIELVAGSLIVLGLFTRPAAFLASGMAAVGYWYGHGLNSFSPIVNGGETIALYCFIFLYISTAGGRRFSIDAMIGRSSKGSGLPSTSIGGA
ncbi:DoxX family protein [Mesorhizobium sp. M0659]|uniref:DoxX family protein n=1 Tax=Mesorhizobium sp. M0659 TaxID=2956980 RepID=UPI003337DFA8